METSSIETVQQVKKTTSKSAVQSSKIEDSLNISTEAQKKADWVKMLHEMPAIREDQIQKVLESAAYSQPTPQVIAAIADKIMTSG